MASLSIARKAKPEGQMRLHKRILSGLSRVGKSLLFPIAMLPIAAILLRIGAQVPDGTIFGKFMGEFLKAGGNAVFATLPILFAIGVGFGLSKDSRGEAAISSFVTMALLMILMSNKGIFGGADVVGAIYGKLELVAGHKDGFASVFGNKYNDILAGNVLNGIMVGAFVSYIYNKFNGIELPSILGFFSGRRLIPVLSVLGGLIVGLLYAVIFPWIGYGLYKFSDILGHATENRWGKAGIMGVYGIINRLLIPFGLHHIPNTLFWFTLGQGDGIKDAAGQVVTGDINIFLKAVAKGNNSGAFQSGFFPVMMFGLPALAASFYFNADGDVQKKRVAALLGGSAIVSFFTGITEPIEFSFLFMAPAIYGMHAILTGFFGLITGLFGIQIGFGFSAGLIDYALSIPKSMEIIQANKNGFDAVMANPAWIWVIGAVAAVTYFSLSTLLIRKFNVSAPGRGENKLEGLSNDETTKTASKGNGKYSKDATIILKNVGGKSNIEHIEWCATRLRFTLKDMKKVNDAAVKKTMAMGTIKVGAKGYQVIIGPKVEMMGEEIKSKM